MDVLLLAAVVYTRQNREYKLESIKNIRVLQQHRANKVWTVVFLQTREVMVFKNCGGDSSQQTNWTRYIFDISPS